MKRYALFAGLSVLLIIAAGVSLLLTPAATRSRQTAVPAYARVVYSSESPERFLSVFPILAQRLQVHEMQAQKQGGTALQSMSSRLNAFQWLEKRPLTVATVLFGGRERRDTWVAVSELGAPLATALRWRLTCFPPKGVRSARSYAVWPIWAVEDPALPSWAKVRFSITESLLIVSVSGDSHDIYRLLNVADGRDASLVER